MMLGSVNDSGSTNASSDIFSPICGRRQSLHEASPHTPPGSDTLPRLKDNSWIGARVSPIPSFGAQEDPEEAATAPYRKSLHDSLEASFVHVGADERTSLLGNRQRKKDRRSSIHPLWEDKGAERDEKIGYSTSRYMWGTYSWLIAPVSASGVLLACIFVHDAYSWYLRWRKGIYPSYSVAWSLPWLSPTMRTLVRFGAFYPARMKIQMEFWRCFSSLFLCTSAVEWLLVAGCWVYLQIGVPRHQITLYALLSWILLFASSAMVGQLWMWVFHPDGIAGCVGWGFSGVLCASGMLIPDQRLFFFFFAIGLLLVDLVLPSNSVFGAVGSSFFGWAIAGSGIFERPTKETNSLSSLSTGMKQVLSLFGVILVITVPIVVGLLIHL